MFKVLRNIRITGQFLPVLLSNLKQQSSGIALIALLPFVISGLFFILVNSGELNKLNEVAPLVFTPLFSLIFLIISVLTLIANRNVLFAMVPIAALLVFCMSLKYAPPFGLNILPNADMTYFYILYIGASVVVFITTIIFPTISSGLFATVAFFLLLDSLLALFGVGWNFLGVFFVVYYPSQISVLVCLFILFLLRLIVKFFQENQPAFRENGQIDARYRRKFRWATLRLWWPMLVLFSLLTIAYQLAGEKWINTPLVAYLNGFEAREKPLVYPGDAKTAVLPVVTAEGMAPQTVEEASKRLVLRLTSAFSAQVNSRVNQRVAKAGNNKDAVIKAVRDTMPARFPGTYTKSCGFLDLGCYIQNGIKSMINSAYVSARDKMIADLARDLAKLEREGKGGAEAFKAATSRRISLLSGQINQGIGNTATGLRYAGLASLLFGILVLIKSYMIVFARVFYARFAAAPVADAGKAGAKKVNKCRMKKLGSIYKLQNGGDCDRYYFDFRVCGNNVVDRRRIPQPLKLAIKRLFSRNYAMCLIDFNARPKMESCDILVDPPAELVLWTLTEADEIFVDFKNLVGFSATCRLQRRFSLRIGALIFGRLVYYSVKGPGAVFIRTNSVPYAATDAGTRNVMQASSLVAWKMGTEFKVVSSLTIGDTFLSGYCIQKADRAGHKVLFDTSQSRRQGTGQGILRMTRAFLLPF